MERSCKALLLFCMLYEMFRLDLHLAFEAGYLFWENVYQLLLFNNFFIFLSSTWLALQFSSPGTFLPSVLFCSVFWLILSVGKVQYDPVCHVSHMHLTSFKSTFLKAPLVETCTFLVPHYMISNLVVIIHHPLMHFLASSVVPSMLFVQMKCTVASLWLLPHVTLCSVFSCRTWNLLMWATSAAYGKQRAPPLLRWASRSDDGPVPKQPLSPYPQTHGERRGFDVNSMGIAPPFPLTG